VRAGRARGCAGRNRLRRDLLQRGAARQRARHPGPPRKEPALRRHAAGEFPEAMSDFTIYPAIDLRQGRVVRLQQGRADAETTYAEDATEGARGFAAQGAGWLHVVNLDGAFGEAGENLAVLRAICNSVEIPVEFGGGLRSRADVEQALKRGVKRV